MTVEEYQGCKIILRESSPIKVEDVINVIDVTRLAARFNRNKSWDVQFDLFTDDVTVPPKHGYEQFDVKDLVGQCFRWYDPKVLRRRTGCWVSTELQDESEAIETAIHEAAHAIVAVGSGHDQSWRRLYSLSLALHMQRYPHWHPRYDLEDRIVKALNQYTQMRYSGYYGNPYGRTGTVWHPDEGPSEYRHRLCLERDRILKSTEKFLQSHSA